MVGDWGTVERYSVMFGKILRTGWGVIMSWCGERVSGSGLLGGEC